MNAVIPLDHALATVQAEEKMFELAQRKAKVYSESSLVPKEYQRNIGNVLIAENMARRMNADPLMVMQNLYLVHGRPGWSAQFLIATFNGCGRFSAIRYKFVGNPGSDDWGCVAYCTERETGELLEGTTITIGIAKREGWFGKQGSKWQTIPEQMLRYRAATFLIKTIAPEIGMGLQTVEELQDSAPVRMAPPASTPALTASNGKPAGAIDRLKDRLLPSSEPALAETEKPASSLPEPVEVEFIDADSNEWAEVFAGAGTIKAAGELVNALIAENPLHRDQIGAAYEARLKDIRSKR